jgi:predicted metal-dependent peptidase
MKRERERESDRKGQTKVNKDVCDKNAFSHESSQMEWRRNLHKILFPQFWQILD